MFFGWRFFCILLLFWNCMSFIDLILEFYEINICNKGKSRCEGLVDREGWVCVCSRSFDFNDNFGWNCFGDRSFVWSVKWDWYVINFSWFCNWLIKFENWWRRRRRRRGRSGWYCILYLNFVYLCRSFCCVLLRLMYLFLGFVFV